jgi:ubiquinol-cytochrome c reductase cytochrome b subunit
MSFWGATVITSLATVIPVVGKTVLSYLWGGLLKASPKKTLLDAGTGFLKQYTFIVEYQRFLLLPGIFCTIMFLIKLQYVWNYFMSNTNEVLLQNKVKIFHMISQSAGLFKPKLIGFGVPGLNSLEYATGMVEEPKSSPSGPFNNSQRPNAGDLMWLVGFVEGDGNFYVHKNGKYVKYEFAIEIHISDIKLLYKIKSILRGIGSITTRKRYNIELERYNTELARLKISSKNDLKRVILSIFDKYGMLTSKQFDYLYFKSCLLQNITYYEHLPIFERPVYTPLKTIGDILNLYYFDAWLVGFMEAESYFSTFQASGESNKTSKFGIVQTNGIQIITAIKERLSFNSNPFINQNTNCCTIDTSNIRGVQNVINFLKNTPVKLKGNKRAQYLKWLHELRVNPRYRNIHIPNHY